MIQRFVLVLSVALIWLSNPPAWIDSTIASFGLDPRGSWAALLSGAAIAIVLLALERLLELFSEAVILPLRGDYKGGVWLYALLPKPNAEFTEERPTVGIFTLRRKDGQYRVTNGRGYQIKAGKLIARGDWVAKCVGANKDHLDLIYELTTHFRYKDEKDSRYKGHIHLLNRDARGLFGPAYAGEFNDLDTRSHVLGPIYAEHASRRPSQRVKCESTLTSRFQDLYDQLEK